MLDRLALILSVIAGINWGLVGLFRYDLVASLFGSSDAMPARVVYVILAAAAIWCVSLLFKENRILEEKTSE